MMEQQDQVHPREKIDREVINNLLQQEVNDYNLVELARLLIRYQNFPGARDIQRSLQNLLQQWQLTEEQLYAKTREIHSAGKVYRAHIESQEQQDWT
jgi:hypothetical protein